jgi:hypothetical protein
MLELFDLKKLAEMSTSERAFLSVYLAGSHSVAGLEKKFEKYGVCLEPVQIRMKKNILTTTSVWLQSIWIAAR